MDLVVDTNIVVSAILKSGITRNMIFNQRITLYSPEHLLIELKKHEKEFMEKSGLNKEQLTTATSMVISNIEIIPFEDYSSNKAEAKRITPDPDDWPFLALALKKQACL